MASTTYYALNPQFVNPNEIVKLTITKASNFLFDVKYVQVQRFNFTDFRLKDNIIF